MTNAEIEDDAKLSTINEVTGNEEPTDPTEPTEAPLSRDTISAAVQHPLVVSVCFSYKDSSQSEYLPGVAADKKNIIDLFNGVYGYDVMQNEEDAMDENDFWLFLQEVQHRLLYNEDNKRYDGLIFVYSGRGNLNTKTASGPSIVTPDGKVQDFEKVRAIFDAASLPQFVNYPKLFLMDARRGVSKDVTAVKDANDDQKYSDQAEADTEYSFDPSVNFLTLYAAATGSGSYKAEDDGGLLISAVVNVLKENTNQELDMLVKLIGNRVDQLTGGTMTLREVSSLRAGLEVLLRERHRVVAGTMYAIQGIRSADSHERSMYVDKSGWCQQNSVGQNVFLEFHEFDASRNSWYIKSYASGPYYGHWLSYGRGYVGLYQTTQERAVWEIVPGADKINGEMWARVRCHFGNSFKGWLSFDDFASRWNTLTQTESQAGWFKFRPERLPAPNCDFKFGSGIRYVISHTIKNIGVKNYGSCIKVQRPDADAKEDAVVGLQDIWATSNKDLDAQFMLVQIISASGELVPNAFRIKACSVERTAPVVYLYLNDDGKLVVRDRRGEKELMWDERTIFSIEPSGDSKNRFYITNLKDDARLALEHFHFLSLIPSKEDDVKQLEVWRLTPAWRMAMFPVQI